MITIENINKIRTRFKPCGMEIFEKDLHYEFRINNPKYFEGKNGVWQPMFKTITLSRVTPPEKSHKHYRQSYLLLCDNVLEWLKLDDIKDIDIFTNAIQTIINKL